MDVPADDQLLVDRAEALHDLLLALRAKVVELQSATDQLHAVQTHALAVWQATQEAGQHSLH